MKPVGMCRMCLVEVSGPRGFSLAAGLLLLGVADGQEIRTASPTGPQGPGGRARVPPRQPPARLPGLRQGRRVPAAGPGALARPGREPLRRGEAPLGQADRPRPARLARPRAVHPVRPLHPLRRGDRRRRADRLLRARRRGSRSPPFPDRPFTSYFCGNTVQICPVGALTAAPVPLQGPPVGPRAGRDDLHDLRGRLPGRRAVLRRTARPATSASTPTRSTRAGCATRAASASRRVDAQDRCATPLRPPRRRAWPRRRGARRSVTVAGHAGAGVEAGARRPVGRRHRRRPAGQRGRLRLGQAGQGRARHRQRRRPARRRPPGRARARPAPGDDRRRLPRQGRSSCCAGDLREELPVLFLRLRAAAAAMPAFRSSSARRCRRALWRASPRPSLIYRPGEAAALAALARRRPPKTPTPPACPLPVWHALGRSRRRARGRSPAAPASSSSSAGRRSPSRRRHGWRPRPLAGGGVAGRRFLPALRRANVHGALDMGLAPGSCPGGSRSTEGARLVRRAPGARCPGRARASTARAMLEAAAGGAIDVLVLLGADPLADFPDRDLAPAPRVGARSSSLSTTSPTPRSQLADVVLPAPRVGERSGYDDEPRGPGHAGSPRRSCRRASPGRTG